MAAYVDDMGMPADVPNGDKVVSDRWFHLMADTHEELMAAAKALRLSPAWIQYPGTAKEHFDLTSGKRQQAIKREIAEPITWRQSGELYAAKVQQEIEVQARADRERLDHAAGAAYRDGDLTRARQILNEAKVLHPSHAGLWESRLEAVSARDGAPGPAPAPEVPPVGAHRDGGTTTRATHGTFPRSPDPEPPHYCPGCTTTTEKDGREIFHGPKIEAGRELCAGCEVQASTRARPAPAHDAPAADRSDPDKPCGKCGEPGVGPGGIICPPCRGDIEHSIVDQPMHEIRMAPTREREAS